MISLVMIMKELKTSLHPKEKMTDACFEAYLYENFPESDLVAHYHEFYEIHMVLSGEVSYWVDGKIYPLNAGNLMLLCPMQLHKPALTELASCQRIVLWINKQYLEQEIHNGILIRCFADGQHLYHAPYLTDIFKKLYYESRSAQFSADIYAQSLLHQILIELSRIDDSTSPSDKPSPLIAEIISYVCEHITEDLCLDKIAQHFHISKFYLSHLFKTQTGSSLYHYIVLKRLSIAKQLLLTGKPAGEVYSACGFRDYSVFYKAFKAEYNQSPTELK